MIRLLSIILVFSCFANTSWSQCCPYVDQLEIIPASPMEGEEVVLVTTVTTPNQGAFISSSAFVIGSTVLAEACYYNGLATALWTYVDTIPLGTFTEGEYNISFSANQSTSENECVIEDSQTVTTSFTVLPLSVEDLSAVPIQVFQDGQGSLNIQSGSSFDRVTLFDSSGRMCLDEVQIAPTEQHQTDIGGLSAGMYVVILWNNRSQLSSRRVAIVR